MARGRQPPPRTPVDAPGPPPRPGLIAAAAAAALVCGAAATVGGSPRAAAAEDDPVHGEGMLLYGLRAFGRRVDSDERRHFFGGELFYGGHAHVDRIARSERFALALGLGASNAGFFWGTTTIDIAVGRRFPAAGDRAFVIRGGGRLDHSGVPVFGDVVFELPALEIAYDAWFPGSFLEIRAAGAPALRVPYVSSRKTWEAHFGASLRGGAHLHVRGLDVGAVYQYLDVGDYGPAHSAHLRACLVHSGIAGCLDGGYGRWRDRRDPEGTFVPARGLELGAAFAFGRATVF
jgi:hypothetical protein